MTSTESESRPFALAIETSQRAGSVALRLPDGAVIEQDFPCGSRERDELLPSIDGLLDRAGGNPADIGVVIVSVGPGSFTGLRIATSTAKALALGVGCKIVALPSAWAMAVGWSRVSGDTGPIVVASAAKGSDCWLTRLEREAGDWDETGATGLHRVVPPDQVARSLCEGAILLADEYIPREFLESTRELVRGTGVPVPSASACLEAGAELERRGRFVPPHELGPLYPREPEAVSLWRARNG